MREALACEKDACFSYGVPVVVYEPTLDAPEFFGSKVTHDLEAFKAGCDVIVANR